MTRPTRPWNQPWPVGGRSNWVIWWLVNTWRVKRDPIRFARKVGVQVGQDCRLLDIKLGTFGGEPFLVRLGDHVTVASGVRFVTHDGGVWVFRDQYPEMDVFGPVTIGNNVFLGINTLLLPNVSIGDNVVIAAGSVVTQSIPSDVVAAGVPARPIRPIGDYFDRIAPRALHIRSLPPDAWKAALLDHFRPLLQDADSEPVDDK